MFVRCRFLWLEGSTADDSERFRLWAQDGTAGGKSADTEDGTAAGKADDTVS
jgi:hypothetical protein